MLCYFTYYYTLNLESLHYYSCFLDLVEKKWENLLPSRTSLVKSSTNLELHYSTGVNRPWGWSLSPYKWVILTKYNKKKMCLLEKKKKIHFFVLYPFFNEIVQITKQKLKSILIIFPFAKFDKIGLWIFEFWKLKCWLKVNGLWFFL